MQRHIVRLGDIHLIFSPNVQAQIHDKQARCPYLPGPEQIIFTLQDFSTLNGVPAAIKQHKNGKFMLFLYTSSYYVAAYPSNKLDGYNVSHVDALNLREHERLAEQGVIWLKARNWQWHVMLSAIEGGNSNYWDIIRQTWHLLEAEKNRETVKEVVTAAHENYLNTIDSLIEATHLLEQDKYKLPSLISYRLIESADEKRYAPRDVYIFHLSGAYQVNERTMVRIKETPDLQGQVIAVKNNTITVKFHGMVDRSRIRSQGSFEPIINSTVYRSQQQAIDTLRKQQSHNPHLLRVLVDHIYQSYLPAKNLPVQSLNSEQLEAFQRALTVPDLLLVLGPPGTGKTRTITEIVRECSTRQQRVLVTSGTHKAVDNVLERLESSNLLVVRVGHEDRVSDRVRPKLLEEQAIELQKTILQQTAYNYQRLSIFVEHKNILDQWIAQLTTCIDNLARANWYMHDTLRRKSMAFQRIGAPYTPFLQKLEQTLHKYTAAFQQQQTKVSIWSQKQVKVEAQSHTPVLGFLFRQLSNYYIQRIERTRQDISALQEEYEAARQKYIENKAALQHALELDPEYRSCEEDRLSIEEYIARNQTDTLSVARNLHGTLQHVVTIPPEMETLSVEKLSAYLSWYTSLLPGLESRAALLHDWRKKLESRNEQQLNPELLRYADVVGATCIGVATAKGLESIDFDIVMIDEAGQIGLPDLLVPLVRAKRSVLVGDHHQLPPFVDREVQTWLDGLSPQVLQALGITDEEAGNEHVTAMLTKSAFEQLFTDQCNPAHIVHLIEQRRMPEVIADFSARHFYEGKLRTYHEDTGISTLQSDPFFTHPMIFVDTSGVPFNQRKERQMTALHNWEEVGITNKIEAELIADIAMAYDYAKVEWVVIVPYRAQAQLIVQKLREKERVDEHELRLEERVATVDSFQGKENRLVIYGFTRSNDRHSVGFLTELRRLNVAMTRARERLLLVGDLSTLTCSVDEGFNHLILSLAAHVDRYGELISYAQCLNRLRTQM